MNSVAVRLALVATLFLTVLVGEFLEYRQERSDLGRRVRLGEPAEVNASLALVAFDSVRGEVTLRIDLAGASTTGLEVIVSTSRGRVAQRFENGASCPTFEASVPVWGYATDYPFDVYRGQFQLECRALPEGRLLRTGFEMASYLPTMDATGAADATGLTFELRRDRLVKAFSIFINGMMWLIGLAILGITTAVAFFGRKVEVNKFGFMAGMLFAFPVVRNLQPGVPPLGIGLDYFATFWAQGIAGLGIFVCACIWIFRQR